jgi:hypothetical protein
MKDVEGFDSFGSSSRRKAGTSPLKMMLVLMSIAPHKSDMLSSRALKWFKGLGPARPLLTIVSIAFTLLLVVKSLGPN